MKKKWIDEYDVGMFYCPYIPFTLPSPAKTASNIVKALTKEKEEMCIPKISMEEMETYHTAESELAYHLSEDIMNEIYKEEVFAQLEKDIQEEEQLVVISRFVREMCDYYKISQEDYVLWQHYYDYLKDEFCCATSPNSDKEAMAKVEKQFNEEMKIHVEETRLEAEDKPAPIRFIGDEQALWNAIEKHK